MTDPIRTSEGDLVVPVALFGGDNPAQPLQGGDVPGRPIRTEAGRLVSRVAVFEVEGGSAVPVTKLGSDVGTDLAADPPLQMTNTGGGTGTISISTDEPAGVPTLDASGLLRLAQMPIDGLNYHGAWNASTNTPALADGSGTAGDLYRVSVAGTQDLGSGPLTFQVGDHVIYEGAVWQQLDPAQAIGWGDIQGTLANQADLQAALDGKVAKAGDTMTGPLNITTTASVPLSTTNTGVGGAGLLSVSDNGAAATTGARLGYKLFGGATDDQHSIYHSAGAEAYASEDWAAGAAGTALRFDVTANGTVARITAMEIHNDGTIDVKSSKIIAVAAGTDPTDGVNLSQLAVERISGTVDLQLAGEDLIWPADVGAGKIRLWNGNGPAVNNRYYGFGIDNGTLVIQGDENVNFTFNKSNASDARIELFRIANTGDLTAQGDLHMSEKRVVNVADGTSPRDAVNRQQLDTKLTAAAAAHVPDADPTSLATLAASIDAIRDALVTAGLMASS